MSSIDFVGDVRALWGLASGLTFLDLPEVFLSKNEKNI